MIRGRSAFPSVVSGYELVALPRLRITSCFTGNEGTKAGTGAQPVSNKGSFYLIQNNPTLHWRYSV